MNSQEDWKIDAMYHLTLSNLEDDLPCQGSPPTPGEPRILGDRLLVWDWDGLLLEGMRIGDPVHHRHQEVESRLEDLVKSPQALHHPGDLLGHHHDTDMQPWGRDAMARLFRAGCAVPGQ